MKFLSEEWFEKHQAKIKEELTPGKACTAMTELYLDCPDGTDKWIYYRIENGLLAEIKMGVGKDTLPEATFGGSGKYTSYVMSAKGELDPVKSITQGHFKFDGKLMKALPMLGIYNKVNAAKVFPENEY
ncbi:MAG: hypothetical protein Q4A83_04245 [Bacillota bacterium]|nr:hypothetical protein [Bacillota bacterium]